MRVVGYLGTWVDPYADPGEDAEDHVSVQYYVAVPLADTEPTPAPGEVAEVAWWPLDDPPAPTAPPETLDAALAAVRAALEREGLETALPDRPRPR